ncbi:MAG: ABC transporter permease [Acidobacteriota bacterium]|nr:ABC transporter permease [Acidobacteriota bacterium]
MLRLLLVSAQIAVRALGRNRFRTVLTMLGVVIGVAAVIAMVALGSGARGSVQTSLKSAGTNIIQVSSGNYTRGGESMNIASGLGSATTLTPEDAEAIRKIAGIQAVASGVRNRAWAKAPHRQFFTQVRGVESPLADIHGWEWLGGRIDAPDGAVMGRAAARELFGEGFDPVGERITIGDRQFVVTGYFRTNDTDMDETVFVPLAAGQSMLNIRHLHTITIAIEQAGDASRIASAVTDLLRERHRRGRESPTTAGLGGNQAPGVGIGGVDDFTVKTQAAANVTKGLYTSVAAFALANMPKLDEVTLQEMSSTLSRAGSTMTALLGSIAAISLIVGGIGIMNIMLVSVTERTKEIGIRLAVGARRRDVLLQFLVEAMMMSLIGGAIGVAIGLVTAEFLTAILDWPTEVSLTTVASAFGIAALVGIVFGYYPARRASRLDPIDSLRYE